MLLTYLTIHRPILQNCVRINKIALFGKFIVQFNSLKKLKNTKLGANTKVNYKFDGLGEL